MFFAEWTVLTDCQRERCHNALTMLLNWLNLVVLTAGWASGAGRLSRGPGWCGFGWVWAPAELSPDDPGIQAPTHWSCCCSGSWNRDAVALWHEEFKRWIISSFNFLCQSFTVLHTVIHPSNNTFAFVVHKRCSVLTVFVFIWFRFSIFLYVHLV